MSLQDIGSALPDGWAVSGASDDGDCVVLKHTGGRDAVDLSEPAALMASYGYMPGYVADNAYEFRR